MYLLLLGDRSGKIPACSSRPAALPPKVEQSNPGPAKAQAQAQAQAPPNPDTIWLCIAKEYIAKKKKKRRKRCFFLLLAEKPRPSS